MPTHHPLHLLTVLLCLQVEPWIKYNTKEQQLQLLTQVLQSKALADQLAAECQKTETPGEDLVAKQRGWSNSKRARKMDGRSLAQAAGGTGYVYNEFSTGGAGGQQLISGPQGLVARAEKQQRNKKLLNKLTAK